MTCGYTTKRRSVWLMALGMSLGACATGGLRPDRPADELPIVDPPPRAGAPTLLIAMPNAPDFVAVRTGLVAEVGKNFNISTLVISSDTKTADVAQAIERVNPVCAVLMNNATMSLFHKYESTNRNGTALPTVVVMSSFLEEIRSKLRRATGIAFEVPGVTAFVNLRAVVNTPINRVGVVYRAGFQKFVERQKLLAAKERVEIVPALVANDVTAEALRSTLHAMVQNSRVDAVWMLNDNVLLRDADFIDDTWRSELATANLPLIVGAPNLVDPNATLGTLAIVPDYEALGLQTANLIFDLADNDWQVESHPVELPLSVKTVVDVRVVKANFGLRPEALRHIDKVIE